MKDTESPVKKNVTHYVHERLTFLFPVSCEPWRGLMTRTWCVLVSFVTLDPPRHANNMPMRRGPRLVAPLEASAV